MTEPVTSISKEQASQKKLIEAGKDLFFKYGYKKVTVEGICKAAGISKMTYYRFFDNKIDLVRFILTQLAEEGWNSYQEIKNRDIPFEEKIRATIEMKFKVAEQHSEDLLRDVYSDQNDELMNLLKKLSADMMVEVMADYKVAQEQGQIRKELNLDFIPYFLAHMGNMVNDPALLALYNGNMLAVMKELTNFFFFGILVPEKLSHDEK